MIDSENRSFNRIGVYICPIWEQTGWRLVRRVKTEQNCGSPLEIALCRRDDRVPISGTISMEGYAISIEPEYVIPYTFNLNIGLTPILPRG